MENYAIVRPEHLNHHGYLFGGVLLKWVDEYAWIAASLDFTGCTLVTVAMDDIVFKHRIGNGAILHFHIERVSQGDASATYRVDVFSDEPGATSEKFVFTTGITFVRIDASGKKCSLPKKPEL